MDIDLIRTMDPLFEEELKRDFRPLEVREGDFSYRAQSPDGRVRLIHRRQRKVLFVDPKDANHTCELVVADLGVATQEDPWVMPCDGEVEWAQVLELVDWAMRKRAERAAREAQVNPLRTEAMWKNVLENYEKGALAAHGSSTFGPYQRIQRESR